MVKIIWKDHYITNKNFFQKDIKDEMDDLIKKDREHFNGTDFPEMTRFALKRKCRIETLRRILQKMIED